MLLIDCVPCGTVLSKRLPGSVRAEGKQVMPLGRAPKADTLPQSTISTRGSLASFFQYFIQLHAFLLYNHVLHVTYHYYT